jgi:hypothetical protein
VTDLNTGLIWEKKLAEGDPSCTNATQSLRNLRCVNNQYFWSGNGSQETIWDWLDDLNAANFAGHNDWRIPNLRELHSIVDYAYFIPSTHPTLGPTSLSDFASYYWSSTTDALNPNNAWTVIFAHGVVSNNGKAQPFFVRAVRGS